MGSCASLGMACGDNIVPTVPVNTALPTVAGFAAARRRADRERRHWLNRPTTYALQWQRAAGGDWANVPGAVGATYVASPPTRAWRCVSW